MPFIDRIRLFGWGKEDKSEATVLGFPGGAVEAGEKVRKELAEYLKKSERTIRRIKTPKQMAHVAELCYKIKPPLDEDQLRSVARIAVRYADHDKDAFVIDNRKAVPTRASETEKVIFSTARFS